MVTIHQPGEKIFELADTLLLLSGGRQAYFGPGLTAGDHFTGLGHPLPARTCVVSVTNNYNTVFLLRGLQVAGGAHAGPHQRGLRGRQGRGGGRRGRMARIRARCHPAGAAPMYLQHGQLLRVGRLQSDLVSLGLGKPANEVVPAPAATSIAYATNQV